MAKALFLLFNHSFTKAQLKDAHLFLGISEVREMPEELKRLWSDISPDLEGLYHYLEPVREWLKKEARTGDVALIQGDFGACFHMVHYALDNGITPVYSTTRRKASEVSLPDGTVKLQHEFSHVRFRRYGL